jgi:putative ABC transport system permease protein
MLPGLADDLVHAVRTLRRNPAFSLTVMATLALAIGANIAIFTLANALIFADLPVSHPDRLLRISTIDPKGVTGNLSILEFQAIQRHPGTFSSLFAWLGGSMDNLDMNGAPFAGTVDEIAGDYCTTLGVQPILGRSITPGDVGLDRFTPSRVAVIGYRDWQERYHGSPAVLGKTVLVNGQPYTIVGVHPRSFPGLIREAAADVTIPITAAGSADRVYDRTRDYVTVIGRLRSGVNASQAQAQMEAVWPAIRAATAPVSGSERDSFLTRRIRVESAARGISYLRPQLTRPLYILFGMVGLVLLLACVNLATVALARGNRRAAELSLRAALGAGRWRLLRISLAESTLLSLGGAVTGLALAYWASNRIAAFMWRGYVPLALSLTPDTRVVLFAAALAIAAGVLFGIIPAWRAGRQDARAVISSGARVTRSLGFVGRTLVAIQIALSFAVVACALLFGRSLNNLLSGDPGFNTDHLLVAQLFPRSTYAGFDEPAYFHHLLASLASIPGVRSATLAHDRPVGSPSKYDVVPGNIAANYDLVAPGFFRTLGIRILRGRDFDLRDDQKHPAVAIVSARLARLAFPSGNAIGEHLRIGDLKGELEIVGIASDATLGDPRVPDAPGVYAPIFQHADYLGWANAIVRTSGDPGGVARALRDRIDALGREYPLRIESVGEELDHALVPERMMASLAGFFGALGLLLAAVGLYGLLSYTVSQRIGEIGMRVALGATARAIVALILREVAVLLAIGLGIGLILAFAGGRAIGALLYGLSGHDPVMLLGAAGVLILTAAFAGLIPAVRAARVDPVVALRHE